MQRIDSSHELLQLVRSPDSSTLVVAPYGSQLLGQLRTLGLEWSDTDDRRLQAEHAHRARRSISGRQRLESPPVRMPHHTISQRYLVGAFVCESAEHNMGGTHGPCTSHPDEVTWHPGELSLAHGGALVLSEIASWSLASLSSIADARRLGEVRLRDPGSGTWVAKPTRWRLIMTAAPCPCGRGQDVTLPCICPAQVTRDHRQRIAEFTQLADTVIAYRCAGVELPPAKFPL